MVVMVVYAYWVTICEYPAVNENLSVSLSTSGIPTVRSNSKLMLIAILSAYVVVLEFSFYSHGVASARQHSTLLLDLSPS